MTHDLLSDIIGKLDAEVVAVTVTELRDNTFYASITVQMNGSEIEVDSRPSDAIALAVRSDAPIFAADEVIEESAIEFEGEEGPPENVATMSQEQRAQVEEQFKEFLENVTPDQFAAAEPEDD
jgi:bifunctional DNase/RNase